MSNTIFWKCVTRPFRWIYVNFFNSFRFLAEVIKKCTFLGNLRIITQKGNMETRQMTQFFSCYFSALTVCNIYFWIRKYSKFIFIWSPFGPFWNTSVFGQSYQFGQIIILFQKVDTLMSLKTSFVFCQVMG